MLYLIACRACLSTEGKLEKFNEKTRKIFFDTTGLQIVPGDGLPQYICAECSTYIKKSIAFRKRSRRAHFVLKEIVLVKKQVNLENILSVDRKKTNLISPVSYWNPRKHVCYYYSTADAQAEAAGEAVEPDREDDWGLEEELPMKQEYDQTDKQTPLTNADTSNINMEQASQKNILNFALDQAQMKPSPRVYPGKVYNIKELKPSTAGALQNVDIKLFTQPVVEKKKVYGEFVKEEAYVVNTSAVVADIKADNFRELEKEEAERRQREIIQALNEIQMEDDNDINDDFNNVDDAARDTVPEDIDMEDIFKGVQEDKNVLDFEWPLESKPDDNQLSLLPVKEKKQPSKFILQGSVQLRGRRVTVKALAASSIRHLTLSEQTAAYRQRLLRDPFKSALYKCEICVMTFQNIEAIHEHAKEHNSKTPFKHVCAVCRSRFEEEEYCQAHCAHTHWYAYKCGACPHTHHSLMELVDCWASHEAKAEDPPDPCNVKLKMLFKKQPLKQEQFGVSLTRWSDASGRPAGKWGGRYRCDSCKLVFGTLVSHSRHMKQHESRGSRCLLCEVCGLAFARKTFGERGLSFHMQACHMHTYRCRMCRGCFYNRSQALYHYDRCPKFSVLPEESKPAEKRIYCNMCPFFTSAGLPSLYEHQLSEHGYFRLPSAPALHSPELECPQCKVFFCQRKYLNLHYAREGHGPPGALDLDCGEALDSQEALEAHAAKEHPSLQPVAANDTCKHTACNEILVNISKRINHVREKHPNEESRRRLCDICGKMYKRSSYNKHVGFHMTRERLQVLYHCQFCGHESNSAVLHIAHVLYNHTLKPYCCTLCGGRYSNRFVVREHILKNHVPIRPYECESCERHFSHLDYLHDHCVKVHSVNLKETHKSFFHATHARRIFIYEHMRIDGSLIDQAILASAKIERADYLEHVFEPVDYKEAFFFDPTVDPDVPTRLDPIKQKRQRPPPETDRPVKRKKQEKKARAQVSKRARKSRQPQIEESKLMINKSDNGSNTFKLSIKKVKVEDKLSSDENITFERIVVQDIKCDYYGNVVDETIKSTSPDMKIDADNAGYKTAFHMPDLNVEVVTNEQIEYKEESKEESHELEVESVPEEIVDEICLKLEETAEDVVGELVEYDGQHYVVVDGLLYKIEN